MKWVLLLVVLALLMGAFVFRNEAPRKKGESAVVESDRSSRLQNVAEVIARSKRELGSESPRNRIAALLAQTSEIRVFLLQENPEFLPVGDPVEDENQARYREIETLAFHWGVIDGAAVMSEIRNKDSEVSELASGSVVYRLLKGWISVDPEAALKWYREDFEARERTEISIEEFFPQVFELSPDVLDQFLSGLGESYGLLVGDYIKILSQLRLSQGIASAEKWAQGLPLVERSVATEEVVSHLAKEDAVAAAEYMKSEWPEEFSKESRSAANNAVVEGLAEKNPELAVAFLERLPKGEERDSAISSFALTVVEDDPRTAMDWVESIESPGLREDSIFITGALWARQDPEGAKRWLENAPLDDKRRERIHSHIESAIRKRDEPVRGFRSEYVRPTKDRE
jgi:hypothetical protein